MLPFIVRGVVWMGAGILVDRLLLKSNISKNIRKTLKEGSRQVINDVKKDLNKDEENR